MSYIRPRKYTRKEKNRRRKKTIIIFSLLFFIFANLIWIFNQPFFKVKEVQLFGNETILDQDIKKELDVFFDRKILFLIPRDNILFLNPQKISRVIENQFPRIYLVKTDIVDGNILRLNIEEREPHSLWCKNQVHESFLDEECFFADQRGYIYSKAPYFSEGIFEKIYMNPESLEIGKEVLDKEDFSFFFNFISSLEEAHKMSFTKFIFNENNSIILYFSLLHDVVLEQQPYLVFYSSSKYEDIEKEFSLLLRLDDFKKEFKTNYKNLLLIDFKIPNQIRYKFESIEKEDLYETTNKQ